MAKELSNILSSYLMGLSNIKDCAQWLASIDWDKICDVDFESVAGTLELFATETLEGLRPETDFWRAAAEFVSKNSESVYARLMSVPDVFIIESTSSNIFQVNEITPSSFSRSVESPFWSISPQMAPS